MIKKVRWESALLIEMLTQGHEMVNPGERLTVTKGLPPGSVLVGAAFNNGVVELFVDVPDEHGALSGIEEEQIWFAREWGAVEMPETGTESLTTKVERCWVCGKMFEYEGKYPSMWCDECRGKMLEEHGFKAGVCLSCKSIFPYIGDEQPSFCADCQAEEDRGER